MNLSWKNSILNVRPPTHNKISCSSTNARGYSVSATFFANETDVFGNGTNIFNSANWFDLLGGTPFECSVASIYLPLKCSAAYEKLGDVVEHKEVVENVATVNFITEGKNYFKRERKKIESVIKIGSFEKNYNDI